MSSINSKVSIEKVKAIFTDMKLEDEVNVSAAKAWLSDVFPGVEEDFAHPPPVMDTWSRCSFEARKEVLDKCLEGLKSHRRQLIELLVLMYLTYKDATLVLDKFIKYFEYCSETVRAVPNLVRSTCVWVECVRLQFLAQPLLYCLYQGYTVVIQCQHDSPFIPFLVYLFKSFESSGLPEKSILIEKFKQREKPPEPPVSLYDWFHPMVISHDADFTSAVESLKYVLCSFRGKVPYCPTHVYVQEPICETVFSCIKDQFERIKHGNRFNRYTEIEEIKHTEKTEADDSPLPCDLPVFLPFPGCPFRVYKFWNPMEKDSLVPKPIKGGVILLPYRTDDELISLMKKNPPASTMSVWSESLPTLNRISSYCRTPVVWFNCLGIFDEKTSNKSFDCFSQTKVKMQLCLLFTNAPEMVSRAVPALGGKCSFITADSKDVNAVVKLARQAFLNSQKLTLSARVSIMLKNIEKLYLDGFEFTKQLSIIREQFGRIKSKKWEEVEGVKVIKERIPVGILVIECFCNCHCYHEGWLMLLFSVLAHGNSVIILCKDDKHCCYPHRLLEDPQMTGGSVFMLPLDCTDRVLQAVRRVQPVVRHIRKRYRGLLLHSDTYNISFNLNILNNLKLLHRLSTYQKCKWVPSL